MPYSYEHDLWDKPNSIISFTDNNTLIIEKFQKFIVDYCKSQLITILNQKRCFEKFLSEIEEQKNSDYSFSCCSHYFIEKLLDVLNIHETFNEMLLKEVDEISKIKLNLIKKETKIWKQQKKKILEDLLKENQKHDIEFKRYCNRHNLKETAYSSYLKAEENKSLSRNQVDNYYNLFLNRKSEYQQSKLDYSTVLDNFNSYQLNHYSVLIPEWNKSGKEIEKNRYEVLRSTFTNLSELCRSLASKANEIAEKIEKESELINFEDDCQVLIGKERTGDIPPGPISFKDFDITESELELSSQDNKQTGKVSSSSSDSVSITNGKSKRPVNGALRKSDTIQHKTATLNMSGSSTSSNNSNGIVISGSKLFTKLLAGVKKSMEPSNKNIGNEIDRLEELLEKSVKDNNDEEKVNEIKNKSKTTKIETVNSSNRNSLFQSLRSRPRRKSLDKSNINKSKVKELINKSKLTEDPEFEDFRRRSQSVSSIHRSNELNNNIDRDDQNIYYQISEFSGSGPGTKPKSSTLFSKIVKDRKSSTPPTAAICTKHIEVIRNVGPVEIVSTPAEAIECASRTNSVYVSELKSNSENTYSEINDYSSCPNDGLSKTYHYNYTGSCVAIHDYTTSDSNDMYLSFNAGQQFYIIENDSGCVNNGWLLVELSDRSKCGYVPESYMDTRTFDFPIPMQSNHPMPMIS